MALQKDFEMTKKSFIRSGEGSIGSYDWEDIADGTGIVEFIAQATTDGTNIYYFMHRNINNYATPYSTSATTTSSNYADVASLNFDLAPLNLPRIVKGKAYFLIPIGIGCNSALDTVMGKVVITVSNYTASETIATSADYVRTREGGSESATKKTEHVLTIPLELPRTPMKKGDVLRVNVSFQIKRSAGTTSTVGGVIAYDPLNRDTNPTAYHFIMPSTASANPLYEKSTIMKFYIPFDIDL
jgi:hypothetical protein